MALTLASPKASPPSEGNSAILGLARGGLLNLVGTLLTQGTGFVILIVLAWKLGTTDVGRYSQAFAFLALLELLSLSGFRSGLTRFVAVHRADGDTAALRGTLRLGLWLSAVSATALGAVLFTLAPWLAKSAFNDAGLESLLRFVALTLPFSVFIQAALSATQGFLTMRYFAGIGLIIVPALQLALSMVFLAFGSSLKGVMVALLVADVIGAVLAAVALRSLVGPSRNLPPPEYRLREIFSFSMVSWLASLASTGLLWADIILLGLYLPSADVGRYQVASRLVLMASMAMAPVNASFAPRIADLFRRGRMESLGRAYSAATSWILRISLPGFVLLLAFSPELMRVFGKGFGVGAAVMVVLVAGKLTDAATGPCGLMLNQSGRVALNMVDNVGVLAANVGLNLYLIPRYGILGSAIAWAFSLALVNLARILQVRHTMGLLPFDMASGKGLVAGLVALVAAFGVAAPTRGPQSLLLGIPVTLGVYVTMLLLLGLPDDDRLVLAEFRLRRPRHAAL